MEVFGFYARGERTVASDVDMLVAIEKPIGLRSFELWDSLEDILGVKVDLLTLKAAEQTFALEKHKKGSDSCLRETGNFLL